MTKKDIKNLENISDYSIALMEEIYTDIKNLSHYSSSKVNNKLDDINRKIDLARSYGVNVETLDKQVLDFRVVLFKKDVENKIEEVNTYQNEYSFNIEKIEQEYRELKNEKDTDQAYIDNLMNRLYEEVTRAKINFMLHDIENSEGNSIYTIDRIAQEISIAKEKGINVSDIEELIFG